MTIADSSQTRLAFIKEAVYGTTPTTPVFTKMRYTGDSLKHTRQNISSQEIRPDRNQSDLIQVAGGAEGSVNFEMSYASFDDFLAAALCGTWVDDVLVNGVTRHSFTLEKTFEQGVTDTFIRFTGMMVSTMALNASVQEIVGGSFGFMGKGGSVSAAALAGSTYNDSPTNDVMNAGMNFANLSINGAGSPKLTGVSLETNNNLRLQPVIGSIDSAGVGMGQFTLNGTVTMYFENKDAYELFLAGTASDLKFTIGGAVDKQYIFTIPKLKFNDGDVPTPGNNQDVILTLPFTALFDPAINGTIEVERVPE